MLEGGSGPPSPELPRALRCWGRSAPEMPDVPITDVADNHRSDLEPDLLLRAGDGPQSLTVMVCFAHRLRERLQTSPPCWSRQRLQSCSTPITATLGSLLWWITGRTSPMIAVFVGYGSHFFADMMTLGGVQLFWPSRLIMDQKIRMTELPPATSAPYMRPVSLLRSNCGQIAGKQCCRSPT